MEVVQQTKLILNHLYRKCKSTSEIGGLAQLIEHRLCTAGVTGLSPVSSTNTKKKLKFLWKKHEDFGYICVFDRQENIDMLMIGYK